jgi:probable phosphoglycerate mutase
MTASPAVPAAFPPAGADVPGLRLVLVRHGHTTANAGHVLDTRPPGAPLDALGEEQARALAARLAGRPVRAVHASATLRARATAEPVAAAHGLPVEVVDGVHEIFCGDLEGRSGPEALEAFGRVYDAWWRGELDARLPGGESALDLRARYLPAVERILAGRDGGDVVLVSHGAAIRLAAAALLGDTAETWYVPNAGLVVLRRAGGAPTGWVLEAWDTAPREPGDVTAGGTPT